MTKKGDYYNPFSFLSLSQSSFLSLVSLSILIDRSLPVFPSCLPEWILFIHRTYLFSPTVSLLLCLYLSLISISFSLLLQQDGSRIFAIFLSPHTYTPILSSETRPRLLFFSPRRGGTVQQQSPVIAYYRLERRAR